jgi:chromosome segregation ATPase
VDTATLVGLTVALATALAGLVTATTTRRKIGAEAEATSVSTMGDVIDTVRDEMDRLRDQVKTYRDRIDRMTDDLDNARQKIADLEHTNDDLRWRLARLEELLVREHGYTADQLPHRRASDPPDVPL